MTGDVWIVSYVLLWLAVIALSMVVVALLRQVGVLHARLRPLGAAPAGEGPDVGAVAPPLPGSSYGERTHTLIAFTSATCVVCEELAPALHAIEREYRDLAVARVALETGARPVFTAFGVRSTPFFVVVDAAGVVRSRGIANSLEQIEVLLEEADAHA